MLMSIRQGSMRMPALWGGTGWSSTSRATTTGWSWPSTIGIRSYLSRDSLGARMAHGLGIAAIARNAGVALESSRHSWTSALSADHESVITTAYAHHAGKRLEVVRRGGSARKCFHTTAKRDFIPITKGCPNLRVEQKETRGAPTTPHKVCRISRYSATMLLWIPCFAMS
jgi:hypothetical protein